MLTREYILSDAGQENLAKGYARPIRENVKLISRSKSILITSRICIKMQNQLAIKKHGKKQRNKFHKCAKNRC